MEKHVKMVKESRRQRENLIQVRMRNQGNLPKKGRGRRKGKSELEETSIRPRTQRGGHGETAGHIEHTTVSFTSLVPGLSCPVTRVHWKEILLARRLNAWNCHVPLAPCEVGTSAFWKIRNGGPEKKCG